MERSNDTSLKSEINTWIVLPILSDNRFRVSVLIIRSLVHFKFSLMHEIHKQNPNGTGNNKDSTHRFSSC